jgi:hypothetical protein
MTTKPRQDSAAFSFLGVALKIPSDFQDSDHVFQIHNPPSDAQGRFRRF